MTDPIQFTAWLRLPPSRRWRLIATTTTQAAAQQALDAATKGHEHVDTFISERNTNPNDRTKARR